MYLQLKVNAITDIDRINFAVLKICVRKFNFSCIYNIQLFCYINEFLDTVLYIMISNVYNSKFD